MATLTDSGRAALAEALKGENLYLGLATGDSAWDTPATFVAETRSITDITNAICFVKITDKQFVTSSNTGSIILPQGRFEISQTATPNLYLKASLNFTEATTAVIREVAVFKDVVFNDTITDGQTFFDTSHVTSHGQLVFLDRQSSPINRSAGRRETFEFVITI